MARLFYALFVRFMKTTPKKLPSRPPLLLSSKPKSEVKTTNQVNVREPLLNDANDQINHNRVHRKKIKCPENTFALAMCPNAAMNIQSMTFDCTTIRKPYTFYSDRWGNVISPYWAARTIAELGGYDYRGEAFGEGTWMYHLPTKAKARPQVQSELFNRVCTCDFEFFHACTYSAGYIADTVATDTRMAIRTHAKTLSNKTQRAIFDWKRTDWLIYDRCCLVCPPQGFVNIHAFDVLPQTGNYTIYTLTQKNADKHEGAGLCGKLHQLRDAYIRRHNPNVTIVPLEGTDIFVDWARCVFFPNLLIPSAGSSWLFYTSLSNTGNVHVGKPQLREPFDRSAIPNRIHVFEDNDNVMTPPQAERLLSVTINGTYDDFIATRKGQEAVLNWYVAGTGMGVNMDKLTRQE